MASEKFMTEYSEILRKRQMYSDNMKDVLNGTMEDEKKKKVLVLFLRRVNDLILDSRKIYYDTKSSYREVEFEKSKQVFKDCLELQNKIYEHLMDLETSNEMSLRYSIAIRKNNSLIFEISNDFIKNEEKTK